MENFKRKSIASFFIMLFVICTFSPMMAVAATHPPDNFTLTTHTIGNGIVTIDPNLTEFVNGTVVNLTAVPDPGWQFVNWTGDITETENPTTITMDANKTVIATFVPDEPIPVPGLTLIGQVASSSLLLSITAFGLMKKKRD
ncbi:MAG: hypothetical protein HF967_03400 [Methanosarcinales archaeon]|nr:hypothetical protein [Methanosarcinales archaeon]